MFTNFSYFWTFKIGSIPKNTIITVLSFLIVVLSSSVSIFVFYLYSNIAKILAIVVRVWGHFLVLAILALRLYYHWAHRRQLLLLVEFSEEWVLQCSLHRYSLAWLKLHHLGEQIHSLRILFEISTKFDKVLITIDLPSWEGTFHFW